jgi:hypothetical protein
MPAEAMNRDVEHDHELRDADHREDVPAPLVRWAAGADAGIRHEVSPVWEVVSSHDRPSARASSSRQAPSPGTG